MFRFRNLKKEGETAKGKGLQDGSGSHRGKEGKKYPIEKKKGVKGP